MEAAVKVLKMGKLAGVDNIPSRTAELVQTGGESMIDILTAVCNKIWKTGEWPTTWTQSLVITLQKKGNLQLCQNYRTISLISHPSKIMLKITLNRLQPQPEEIIAEEQGAFLSVAWPTGVQLLVFFCSSVPVVLFDTPGISRCRSQHISVESSSLLHHSIYQ